MPGRLVREGLLESNLINNQGSAEVNQHLQDHLAVLVRFNKALHWQLCSVSWDELALHCDIVVLVGFGCNRLSRVESLVVCSRHYKVSVSWVQCVCGSHAQVLGSDAGRHLSG